MGHRLFSKQNRSGIDKTGFLMQMRIGWNKNLVLIFNRLPKIDRRHLWYGSPFLLEAFALAGKNATLPWCNTIDFIEKLSLHKHNDFCSVHLKLFLIFSFSDCSPGGAGSSLILLCYLHPCKEILCLQHQLYCFRQSGGSLRSICQGF